MAIKKCKWCGKEFEGRNQQRYCSKSCKDKMNEFSGIKYQHKELVEKSQVIKKSNRRRPKYNGPSIVEITVLARQEGLTYGQYVKAHGL